MKPRYPPPPTTNIDNYIDPFEQNSYIQKQIYQYQNSKSNLSKKQRKTQKKHQKQAVYKSLSHQNNQNKSNFQQNANQNFNSESRYPPQYQSSHLQPQQPYNHSFANYRGNFNFHENNKEASIQSQNLNNSTYSAQMEQILLSETANTIQYLINENTQMAQKLSTQNLYLMKHMQNLNRLMMIVIHTRQNAQNQKIQLNLLKKQNSHKIINKDKNNHRMQNIKQQNQYSTFQNGIQHQKNQQDDEQINYYNKNQDTLKLSQSTVHKVNKIQNFKALQKIISQGQSVPKLTSENSNQKSTFVPLKGAMNYQKPNWVVEQTSVLKFIGSYLKNIIKKTDNLENVISKKQLITLYLQWRKLNNIQNEMNQACIQQIITHQMKDAFKCEFNSRNYMGLSWTLEGFQNNSSNQQNHKNQVKQFNDCKQKDIQSASVADTHRKREKRRKNLAKVDRFNKENEDDQIQEITNVAEFNLDQDQGIYT